MLLWTALLFLVLELITGNIVEPLLYSSSTGLSPIAVLIAAIFWTLLWGLPGLLLSTPLTVCLVVIGRQVPHLQYLDVLFGDETALPPPERFYQRLLSSNNHEARALLDGLLATKSKEQVYDSVVIPVLTLIEESRHAEELTSSRAEEVLLAVEELAEDVASRIKVPDRTLPEDTKARHVHSRSGLRRRGCLPACQPRSDPYLTVRVIAADTSISDVLQTIDSSHPDAICVVGSPLSRSATFVCAVTRFELASPKRLSLPVFSATSATYRISGAVSPPKTPSTSSALFNSWRNTSHPSLSRYVPEETC